MSDACSLKSFPSTVCDVCLILQVIAYTSIRCSFVMHPDWLYMHHILSSVFDTKKHRKHILRIGFIIVSRCWQEGKNHSVSFLNLFIHVILMCFFIEDAIYFINIHRNIQRWEKVYMADAIIYLKHYRRSVRVQQGSSKIYSILNMARNKQWITHLKTFWYHNAILFILNQYSKCIL